MNIKIIRNTPLSVAVIAGRTAWQSFHKGGNYNFSTDNITEEDFKFLDRLFNKYKHISVAEHIWYTFLIEDIDLNFLTKLKNEYNFYSKCNDKIIFSVNLRTILEELRGNYNGSREIRAFYIDLLDYLPEIHRRLIKSENYLKNETEEKNNFQYKTISNDLNHSVTLLYHHKKEENCDFSRRPHSFYSFRISGISRALLQELVRHDDLLGITVKSTRYTLKELKDEKPFVKFFKYDFERAKKYLLIVPEMNKKFIKSQIKELEILRKNLVKGISNDKAKYLLPESYKTELVITLNELNFKNLLKLRTDKSALWEFQSLAKILELFK